jgi:hypothetical protein
LLDVFNAQCHAAIPFRSPLRGSIAHLYTDRMSFLYAQPCKPKAASLSGLAPGE